MSERSLRLILAGVMFATLWLPVDLPLGKYEPYWFFNLYVTVEAVGAILRGIKGIYFLSALCAVLSVWTVPFLILFNAGLAVCPFKGLNRWLRIPYRIVTLILLLLTWRLAFQIDPFYYRMVGFWVNIAVVSAAALLEIVFIIMGRRLVPATPD